MNNEGNQSKGHLFNLIVYTHEKRRFEYYQRIVKAFTEKFPCRVIFIKGENNGGSSSDNQSSSSEFFTLHTSPAALHQIPFLILPKLIPDLPIYLVWGQNPTSDNEILPQLEKLAVRFVFDAECAKNLTDFSVKMLQKISALKIDFMDVGWAEVSVWRDVLARSFDSPEKLSFLNECSRILIKHNKIESEMLEHAAIQAIYLQGWLAAQLEWKFESLQYHENIELRYAQPQTAVEVSLIPQSRPALAQGRIFEVEFQTPKGLKMTMSLAEKQAKIMVYMSTLEKCELPFSFPAPDLSKGLSAIKELFYHRAGAHYTNMLNMLKQVPWKEF